MPPTIKDIAERSGVGLGTVSRVLNNSGRVSASTRERVMQAIRDLNYVPNAAARGLSRGRTMNVAAVAPFFTRAAFVERLRAIEAAVSESQYDLVVYNVETVDRRDRCFRAVPDPRRVDGVIIISLPPSGEDLIHLAKTSIPVVFVDVTAPACVGFDRVFIDDVSGGRLATDHLIGLGHRRIGYLGDIPQPGFMFTSGIDRFSGYCRALQEAGLPLRADYHRDGSFGQSIAREMARGMLSLSDRPTAIVASSDTQAVGVLQAAADLGLDVPGDLSVTGYDDIEVADYLGLTTIRQSLDESGRRAVAALLRRIADPGAPPVCETLPLQLIVRRTTAPPR